MKKIIALNIGWVVITAIIGWTAYSMGLKKGSGSGPLQMEFSKRPAQQVVFELYQGSPNGIGAKLKAISKILAGKNIACERFYSKWLTNPVFGTTDGFVAELGCLAEAPLTKEQVGEFDLKEIPAQEAIAVSGEFPLDASFGSLFCSATDFAMKSHAQLTKELYYVSQFKNPKVMKHTLVIQATKQ